MKEWVMEMLGPDMSKRVNGDTWTDLNGNTVTRSECEQKIEESTRQMLTQANNGTELMRLLLERQVYIIIKDTIEKAAA